jgi:hypothetical protein
MKQVLDAGWVSLASSAVLGAAAALISASFWVSDHDLRLDAAEMAIVRMDDSLDGLSAIQDRLARIETKLDLLLSGRSLR